MEKPRNTSEDTACDDRTRDRRSRLGASLRQNSGPKLMPDNLKPANRQPPLELIPDFLREDRHEFVSKVAYKLWEERGRPFG